MKVLLCEQLAGLDELKIRELPDPEVTPGKVKVVVDEAFPPEKHNSSK